MAIILYNRAGMLSAGRLRARLADALPLRRWICGEDDDGTPGQTIVLRGHQLICGRGPGAPLFVELRCVDAPYVAPGETLPPHAGYIRLPPPTTDDPAEADIATALIVEALMDPQAGGAWCQLTPDGGWMAAAALGDLPARLRSGEKLAHSAGSRSPAPDRRPVAPAFHSELPRTDRLPTLLALLAPGTRISLDWPTIAQGLDYCDPDGDWRVDPRGDGGATLSGRHGRIAITPHAQPMPADWLGLAIGRSFWLPTGAPVDTLRQHIACLAVASDSDTTTLGPIPTRQLAKAMSMALLLIAQDLARDGHLSGLANAAHATLYAPSQMEAFARAMAEDEVPIPLFVATAFHATTPGAISLSTAGLMPFVGREVEAWNAPGDIDSVGDRLSNVLRYLLSEGPVLRHGDTLGTSPGDRGIRVLMGTSRADRPYAGGQPIPALWLEFGEARPYPPRAQPSGMAVGGVRRPGGFGRKGL